MANNSNDKKKYNKMELVLQNINRKFVTVSKEDTTQVNPLLKHVIVTIIEAMKQVNPLFKSLYESVLYGGSFYDGLKVGKPEEFDIDLKLVLPTALKLSLSNQPGFVKIQFTKWAEFEKEPRFEKFKGLGAFKDKNDFLLVSEVLKWIESTVNLALNKFAKKGTITLIPYDGKTVEVTLKKSGPAVTALIKYGSISLDVDLVAVFKLTADHWPPCPFRALPKECADKKEFLIVPKAPKVSTGDKDRCWRMSFQEQERVLITGNNTCKPALRLIKKLRDTQTHNLISSYFIKTVFLHEIDKQDKQFWNNSLSYVFMHMLKTYRDYLNNNKIPYYWNKNNNLLAAIDKTTIDNFTNFLNRIIDSVDKKLEDDPYIIGMYLCTSHEYSQIDKLAKTKSNGQDSNLGKIFNEVNSPITTNSDETIKLLNKIQSDINQLNSNVKIALSKISSLELSVEELKDDHDDFRNHLKNIEKKINNTEFKGQDSNDLLMAIKLASLQTSVKKLETDKNLLKNGLKQFVLPD